MTETFLLLFDEPPHTHRAEEVVEVIGDDKGIAKAGECGGSGNVTIPILAHIH